MTFPTSPPALAILLDMTATHVPVLAGELIDVIDPQPGDVAVDCTFGGGGHARLVAGRLGPEGTLIAVDRDPAAEERFAALADEAPCRTRFIRASFAEALEQLRAERVAADLVYMDLGMSSMQVDTWARGFSYAYDAPLDMRMDQAQELTAADVVNGWDQGTPPPPLSSAAGTSASSRVFSASTGRSATPARSRGRSCATARGGRSRRQTSSSRPSSARCPRRRGSPPAIRPSACSRRSASRSTTSSRNSTPRF